MARFHKAMLECRTYHAPGGETVVTPKRLSHWAESFKKMKARGEAVPCGWGHSDEESKNVPVQFSKLKEKWNPRETAGYLESFEVSDDGQRAELIFDVRGRGNIQRADQNLASVSPVIVETWKDGFGNRYEDCITKMDFVQKPVDQGQTEFKRVRTAAVQCSALRMSLDGTITTYQMADDMADDEAPKDDEPKDEPTEPTEEQVVDDAGGRLTKVLDALAGLPTPIVLSDDTNEENFLQNLENALLTVSAMSGGIEPEATDEMQLESPVMMSMDASTKKVLDGQHRSILGQRLDLLFKAGKCTPPEFEAKSKALPKVSMSIDAKGNTVPGALEQWIESREAVPEKTFFELGQRTEMSYEVAAQPKYVKDGEKLSNEDADEVVDKMFQRRR